MFEPEVQLELDIYIRTLRHELDAQGLASPQIDEIAQEVRCHLGEAMECSEAQTAAQARRVLAEFGTAKRLATQHGVELNRPRKNNLIWPVAVLLFLLTFHQGFLDSHIPHYGALSLWVGGALLFWFGFRGRKPILSQFVFCITAYVAVQTVWNTAVTVPTVFTSGDIQAVGIRQIDNEKALLQKSHASLQAAVTQIHQGMLVFTKANEGMGVPKDLMYGGGYWTPEGIRELHLSIPAAEIDSSFHVKTWDEAVKAWSPASFSGPIDAIRICRVDQQTLGSGLESLEWIQRQPISVRAAISFYASLFHRGIGYLIFSLTTANAGWLIWKLLYAIRVNRRRRQIQYGLATN
jgi:hypothetical protein